MGAEAVNGEKSERKKYTLPQLRHLEHVLDRVKKLLHKFTSIAWSFARF